MRHMLTIAAVLLVAAACASAVLRPAENKLAPWTEALRAAQPDEAFAAVYRVDRRHLVFLGAKHATRTDSPTFRLIEDAYGGFEIDTVIVEGFPTSRGPNADRLIEYAKEGKAEEANGFQQRGETVPAVLGGLAEGATVWGGEPDDSDIKQHVIAQGFSERDLLGFYTLRSIPQWIREQRIDNAGDPAIGSLLDAELVRNRERLGLGATVLSDADAWHDWYRSENARPLDARFSTEEAGPLADGPYGSNAIAAAISKARAAYLHRLVIDHLNRGETVLVVFGGSHLMIHRPALDTVLGSPCYSGDALSDALSRCRF